jgi:hypothetical protein
MAFGRHGAAVHFDGMGWHGIPIISGIHTSGKALLKIPQNYQKSPFPNLTFTLAAITTSKMPKFSIPKLCIYTSSKTKQPAWHGAASTFQKRKTLTLLQIEIKKEKWPWTICSKVRVPSVRLGFHPRKLPLAATPLTTGLVSISIFRNSCSLCRLPALPNLEGAAHCVPW